jgi:hypothetical protein
MESALNATTLIEPRWIAPVSGASAVLEDHAVVIADGGISAVLPRDQALTTFPDTERLHLPDGIADVAGAFTVVIGIERQRPRHGGEDG